MELKINLFCQICHTCIQTKTQHDMTWLNMEIGFVAEMLPLHPAWTGMMLVQYQSPQKREKGRLHGTRTLQLHCMPGKKKMFLTAFVFFSNPSSMLSIICS